MAIPQHLATKIQVKTEELEVKEGPRKRRVRSPEEFEKEAAERRRRAVGGTRKEVVGREDLYSKKELAAQDDRGRHRGDRDRPSLKEVPKAEPAAPKPGETARQDR